jgi:cell division protease FtsH
MRRKVLAMMFCCVVSLLQVVIVPGMARETELTYTQLQNLIKDGKTNTIQKVVVTITSGVSGIEVQMAGSDQLQQVMVPPETKGRLIESLVNAGVNMDVREAQPVGFWFSMLSSFFLPILLLVGFLFMFRSAQKPTK